MGTRLLIAAGEAAAKTENIPRNVQDEMAADARGAVGADDPLTAFEDAIRQFAPDHLLIAIRTGDRADWQERGLLDQLLERFPIPMTVIQVSRGASRGPSVARSQRP